MSSYEFPPVKIALHVYKRPSLVQQRNLSHPTGDSFINFRLHARSLLTTVYLILIEIQMLNSRSLLAFGFCVLLVNGQDWGGMQGGGEMMQGGDMNGGGYGKSLLALITNYVCFYVVVWATCKEEASMEMEVSYTRCSIL